ncbi:MAG: hypothetical protein RL594_1238 [Bacteroidota bacterium]|jgi:serine protease
MKRLISIVLLLFGCVPELLAQYAILPAELPHRPDPVVAGFLKVRLAPEVAHRAHGVLAEMGLTVIRPVLPFEQSLAFSSAQQRFDGSNRMMNRDEALQIEERLLRSFVVAYARPEIPPEMMIAKLQPGCGPIECAAPWCVAELCGEPDDPERGRQDLLRTIQVIDAWEIEGGSDSVIIGISDSGVRTEHEDLIDAIYVRAAEIPGNGIDDDANGYIDDHRGYNFSWRDDGTQPGDAYNPNNGHGTGVAGICDATTNNGKGIVGLAGRCAIFPLRTMPNGTTGIVYGYESIMYCAVNGIDVVNCSWGGQSPSCIDQDVVSYAIARGTAVVAAAGNHASTSPFYPASYRGVLGVGVVDPANNVIPMTGRGPTVDVMAPGQGSLTTGNDGAYAGFCCTSGSAPIASALVALVRSRHRDLGPLEACAIVRDAVDESPWANIPAEIDRLQLPRGRVNALKAVQAHPDTLVSIEIDTLALTAKRGAQRWTVGDTLTARVGVINRLAPWTLSVIGMDGVTGVGRDALRAVSSAGTITQQKIGVGERFFLPPQDFVVAAETDTAAYVHMRLLGTDITGAPINRQYSYAVTPSPAFVTLANEQLRLSVGDRGRIGNTDLERGQGEGFRYLEYCGQLYEGGLMVHANGRTVDAVRAARRNNDHFRPVLRFRGDRAISGVISDADAPDSLRIGVAVEMAVELDSSSNVLRCDVTITNTSDTTLHDLSVGWFYDWDLGRQPASNRTFRSGPFQYVAATGARQPIVVMYNESVFSDAMTIQAGLDNTSTYGGFSTEMKSQILRNPEDYDYQGVNDVAAIAGMRFRLPVPPGHRRTFRHVIVIDTSTTTLQRLLERETSLWEVRPTDSLFALSLDPVFPNPATSMIYVPVDGVTMSPSTFSIYDITGLQVRQEILSLVPGAPFLHPLDITELPQGSYCIRVDDGIRSRTWPLVVVR